MDDEKDPFLDDDDGVVLQKGYSACSGSPILNTPNFSFKSARRRKEARRSGPDTFLKPGNSEKFIDTNDHLKSPPISRSQSFLLSQEAKEDFFASESLSHRALKEDSPGPHSDDDIFGSVPSTADIPTALNGLLDGPGPDQSWTSSMATPLASNVTWSNLNTESKLNTEERRVLLPSADCLAVKPRALFSPGLNDTTDCHTLNISSDAECLQFLKGDKTDKTPTVRGRKLMYSPKSFSESPLARRTVKDCRESASETQEEGETSNDVSRGSPILSGSKEFKRNPDQSIEMTEEEEDLFENAEEPINPVLVSDQLIKKKDYRVAESTPNTAKKKKSPSNAVVTPLTSEFSHAPSSVADVPVSTFEETHKALQLKDAATSTVGTPEKQTDVMRKRQLFVSNPVAVNCDPLFKVPGSKYDGKEVSLVQENPEDCIPDDSFMEHMASMNVSIFMDPALPMTKMQSIKTSVSHMKRFSYTTAQRTDEKHLGVCTSNEPRHLMKEVLSSVLSLESSATSVVKTKRVKSSGDLVVFSQLQEEMNKEQGQEDGFLQKSASDIVKNGQNLSEFCVEDNQSEINLEEGEVSAVLSSCEGFQTANGTRITLSQEALSKGFNILKEALKDKSTEANGIMNTLTLSEDLDHKAQPTSLVTKSLQSNLPDPSDVEAAEEVKQLLQLVSDGEDFDAWHEMEPAPNHIIEPTALKKTEDIQTLDKVGEVVGDDSHTLNIGSPHEFGFSTARGKNISVSEKNITRAKALLKECEDGVKFGDNRTREGTVDPNVNEECLSSADHIMEQNSLETGSKEEAAYPLDRKRPFIQTGTNENFILPNKKACLDGNINHSKAGSVESSSESKATSSLARNNLDEASVTLPCDDTLTLDLPNAFGNVSQRTVAFMNNFLAPSSRGKKPSSVCAASGRAGKSLDRAKHVFANDFPIECDNSSERKDTLKSSDLSSLEMSSNEKAVCPSLSSRLSPDNVTSQVKERLEKFTPSQLKQDAIDKDSSPIFMTASGKGVSVSREALKKAKTFFNDLPDDTVAAKNDFDTNSTRDCLPSIVEGFSTASGKQVDVSVKAITDAERLFSDIPSDPFPSGPAKKNLEVPYQYSEKGGAAGFSTASGRKVTVSKQALNKVKNLFDNLPESALETNNMNSIIPPLSEGFSTASGKKVTVSADALNKVQKMFDDIPKDCDSDSQAHINAFQNVCLSQDQEPHHKNLTVGFSTASGKTVNVSKQALDKVRGLFDTDDLTLGSSVDLVVKETVRKTEKCYGELPRESSHDQSGAQNKEVKPLDYINSSVPMTGFSTASGRSVHVSEKALCKAKNLFEDLPTESMYDVKDNKTASLPLERKNVKNSPGDDSGVFTCPRDTPDESLCQIDKTAKDIVVSTYDSNENKENESCHSENSLTAEVIASTAAILADDELFDQMESMNTASRKLETIRTSPSMVTDRISGLKPILSSAPGGGLTVTSPIPAEAPEPTSPILVKSDTAGLRRRTRKGRLSLSSNLNARSGSPTFGTQYNSSSQNTHRKLPSSLPPKSKPTTSHSSTPAVIHKLEVNCPTLLEDGNKLSNPSSTFPLSRKLFENEAANSPTVTCDPVEICENTSPKILSEITPIKPCDSQQLRHQTPLMRTVLTKNRGPQSSGFKTPYKSPYKEQAQAKRSSSSPARNPPEAKRRKSSSNLYASLIYSDAAKLDPRVLRPEVAEMRRRAAEEQQQLVKNYAEDKGDLLRPCVGSWLISKVHGGKSDVKLMKLREIGQPEVHDCKDLIDMGVSASTLSITAVNSSEFQFSAWDYYSEDVCRENVAGLPVGDGALLVLDSKGMAGVDQVETSFLASPGVDPSLVPSGWVKNHYRWLVWKLAAMERRFPHQFRGRCLSPDMVMLQLKYRYDREVDRCERPALRRILEHDDSAAKRMVLCVASIINVDSNQAGLGLELELTDGWYSVTACIDLDLQHRVKKGIITVGTKLITHGAELVNCSEGCSPLQVRPEVRLKLCSNSTRRARWFAKLGFQDNPGPIKVPLGTILSSGGIVSCVSVYVARVYPLVFMEKLQEKTVVRSQRAESKERTRSETKRQQLAESVYSQVRSEIQKEQTKHKRSGMKLSMKHLSTVTSGEELFEILESSSDPHSVQSMLSTEQKNIIEEHQRIKQEELCREMEERVRSQLSENSTHQRQVTPILKVRLLSCDDGAKSISAILSVWRPSEDLTSVFKEGQKLTIFGAVANGLRGGELQLSANRSTRYHADSTSDIKSDLLRTVFPLASLSCHGLLPRFGELDIVGLVIRISPAPQTPENTSHFQTVYISDPQQNIVALSFWGGLKEFAVDDFITPNTLIAVSNLQWRGGAVLRAIPTVYASELSVFTTNPRQGYLQAALQELRRSLPSDFKAFGRTCEERLDILLEQKGSSAAVSPRTPDPTPIAASNRPEQNQVNSSLNSKYVTPTNDVSVAGVKAQRKLSLDQQLKTPTSMSGLSPAARFAKLEVYGEPPPISPILVSNTRRSIRTQFKAPRRTDSPSVDCKKLSSSMNSE